MVDRKREDERLVDDHGRPPRARPACERRSRALGIATAVIGGLALAHHGYVRATVDVDLASAIGFDGPLRRLADLVALKLYAGSRFDLDDVARVLEARTADELDPGAVPSAAQRGVRPSHIRQIDTTANAAPASGMSSAPAVMSHAWGRAKLTVTPNPIRLGTHTAGSSGA